MPLIPLFYYGHQVAHAQVSQPLDLLSPKHRFTLIVQRSVLKLNPYRPDVILALLKEDPRILRKSHPLLQVNILCTNLLFRKNIRLSHIAFQPELVTHLNNLLSGDPFIFTEAVHHINELSSSVHRITFVNNNRCDCRLENLRSIGAEETYPLAEPSPLLE